MTRIAWLATFPRARRDELLLAYSNAIYTGRATIARYVEGRGGVWAEGCAR